MSLLDIDSVEDLLRIGEDSCQKANYEHCVAVINDCLTLLASKDHTQAFECLRSRAYCLISKATFRLGDNKCAFEQAQTALKIAEMADSPKDRAAALVMLATICQNLSDHAHSLNYSKEAIAILTAIDDKKLLSIAHGNMGITYLHMCDYKEALYYMRMALEAHVELNMNDHAARVMGNIGTVYRNLGDFVLALEYLFKALDIHKSIGARHEEAIALATIGSVYHDISDFQNALHYLSASLDVFRDICDMRGAAAALGNLGVVYFDISKASKEGFDYTQQALELFRKSGMKAEEAIMLCNIGNYYRDSGKINDAIQFMSQALDIHRQIGHKYSIALDLENIGLVYLNQNQYDKSEQYLLEAEALFAEIGNQLNYAHVHGNLGNLYAISADHSFNIKAKAEKYLKEALTINLRINSKKDQVYNHRDLAFLFKKQQRWEEYAEHIEKKHFLEIEVISEAAQEKSHKLYLERKISEIMLQRESDRQATEREKFYLEQIIQTQKRQLENDIAIIVEKNRFLTDISSVIRSLQRFTKGEGHLKADELIEKIRQNIGSFDSLGMLDKQLNEVHGDFMVKLKEKFPSLTPMEVKIAVLLRMKLTSPNIGSLLYISHRTVELHRARIRRKVGLNTSDNIYIALQEM